MFWNAHLGVGARAGNDGTLDSQRGRVTALVTRDDGDLAVSSDERRGREGEDEEVGVHFEVVYWRVFRTNRRESVQGEMAHESIV